MREWVLVAVVAGSVGLVSSLLLVCIWRWCYQKQRKTLVEPLNLQSGGIARLHHANYHAFGGGVSGKPLFNWSDHPSLAADAVENGWSRFAFTGHKTYYVSSPSKRTGLLGLGVCGSASGDPGREEAEAEISWEVSQGSVDFMQKIRFNPGLKTIRPGNPSVNVKFSVIRTALPLPGPPLGNCSFPQQAYFEITVQDASGGGDYDWNGKDREGEKIKLIQDDSNSKENNIEEMRVEGKGEGKSESVMFSVGLTSGGFVPLRLPGSSAGSIGFNSNGCVFLEGKFHGLRSC